MDKKIALITGASSGFGLETAKLLSKNGYKLILVARRGDVLQELASKLNTEVFVRAIDVRNKQSIHDFFKDLHSDFQKIDVLINNAGLALGVSPAYESDIEDWETMIDTNIKGLLYFTSETLQIMKKRNTGHIVNIGSVAAHAPYKGGNVYGSTKAFVKQFSRNLRADLLGTDIRVTNIEPGIAETEFSIVRFKGDKEKAGGVYKDTRALTAQDIAETILWILERPLHVNIDNIEIMPIDQSWGGLAINRKS